MVRSSPRRRRTDPPGGVRGSQPAYPAGDLRGAPTSDAVQPDLFSGTQVVQRTLPRTGTRVRLRLAPLGHGRVRVVEAVRRPAGATRYEPWPEEEGRETDLERLCLGVDYLDLFGG